jgi:hypothetical protein
LLECETDHLLPSSAKLRNVWSFISMSLIALCLDTGKIFSLPFIAFHSNEVPCELIYMVYFFEENSESVFFI